MSVSINVSPILDIIGNEFQSHLYKIIRVVRVANGNFNVK